MTTKCKFKKHFTSLIFHRKLLNNEDLLFFGKLNGKAALNVGNGGRHDLRTAKITSYKKLKQSFLMKISKNAVNTITCFKICC